MKISFKIDKKINSFLYLDVFEFGKKVEEKKCVGEFFCFSNQRHNGISADVNLSNVSHKINYIKESDDDLIGEIELLDTPNGILSKKIIKCNKASIMVAPRMLICPSLASVDSPAKAILLSVDFCENMKNKRYSLSKKKFYHKTNILKIY
jgi:hypothetical protein